MKSVMLTGATGFIGSHIADRLLSENTPLNLLVRKKNPCTALLEERGARVFEGGGETPDIIKEAASEAETIIHCAGATVALNEKEYMRINLGFTSKILDTLSEGQNFLLISSQAAAGPSRGDRPTTEESPPLPVTSYGRSKLASEQAVSSWGKENGNRFTILRPAIVYGPRERGLFHYFKLAERGLFITMGESSKRLSMVHVDDMVDAVSAAAGHPFTGKTYFVSNNESYSWDEIRETFKESSKRHYLFSIRVPEFAGWVFASFFEFNYLLTGRPGLINFEKITEAGEDGWICCNRRIRDELGWSPLLSLSEGFIKTREWYLREGWL